MPVARERHIPTIIALCALGVLASSGTAHGRRCDRVLPVADREFDHREHERALHAADKTPIACDGACHTMTEDEGDWKLKRMAVHQRCSDSGCHRRPRRVRRCRSLPERVRSVCYTCHTTGRRADRRGEAPDEAASEGRFATSFPHATHVEKGIGGEPCQACHKGGGTSTLEIVRGSRSVSHAHCATCHASGRAPPSMRACQSCHDEGGATTSPAPQENPYAVSQLFDHRRHARASGSTAEERACVTCHDNLSDASGAQSRPTMMGCYRSCHDGKRAFNAIADTCTRCHRGGGLPEEALARVTLPTTGARAFGHRSHGDKGVAIERCTTCHALDAAYNPQPPTRTEPHQACAQCHRDDFFARQPTMCQSCHEQGAYLPWRTARAALQPGASGEFSWVREAGFSHQRHIDVYHAASEEAGCATCHTREATDATSQGAHAPCARCHADDTTGAQAQPSIGQCESCHKLGANATPDSEWRVGERFSHERHERDPRKSGGTTECSTCHVGVAQAADLAAIARPTMESCDGCHDGQHAFKTTGFGCARCHGGRE